ncbi:MAG: hypothetical protein WAM14_21965 [Candidatus Nitrosopolaris sp.]
MTHNKLMAFIEAVKNFSSYTEAEKSVYWRVNRRLESKQFSANSFEEYSLRGTLLASLVDKNRLIRHIAFGSNCFLEGGIEYLLNE